MTGMLFNAPRLPEYHSTVTLVGIEAVLLVASLNVHISCLYSTRDSTILLATYDHRYWKARDPVRSPIDKPVTARLVVGSVTTSESLVLYVSFFGSLLCFSNM